MPTPRPLWVRGDEPLSHCFSLNPPSTVGCGTPTSLHGARILLCIRSTNAFFLLARYNESNTIWHQLNGNRNSGSNIEKNPKLKIIMENYKIPKWNSLLVNKGLLGSLNPKSGVRLFQAAGPPSLSPCPPSLHRLQSKLLLHYAFTTPVGHLVALMKISFFLHPVGPHSIVLLVMCLWFPFFLFFKFAFFFKIRIMTFISHTDKNQRHVI